MQYPLGHGFPKVANLSDSFKCSKSYNDLKNLV